MLRSMLRFFFLLLVVYLVGWVALPAYSAYQIYTGMKTADEGLLRRKINWSSMRQSLRPVVTREVEKSIGRMGSKGMAGALMPQLKKQFMPQIVDLALKNVVTPRGLTEVMAHGGDVSGAVKKIVSRQIGKMGGLGALTRAAGHGGGSSGGGGLLGGLLGGGDAAKGVGGLLGGLVGSKKVREMAGSQLGRMMGGARKAAPEANKAKPAKPSYGLSNIKHFAYTGIGSMEMGVARDPAKKEPDVTAVMEFQDFQWKLTGLVPNLH